MSRASLPQTTPAGYLERIGVSPETVGPPDAETLERLQRAHVTSVPFETLSITGDPYGDREGEGVSLALDDVHEKLVERGRGGFCYELNGLFGWLLDELVYDVDRAAGMVLDDDGNGRPPANHLTLLVSADPDADPDRRVVVDVGMGSPRPRKPIPLDGTPVEGDAGVAWRVRTSDRPDVEYLVQLRIPGNDWTDRYVFDPQPREMAYFRPTCDYLQSAPESPFTGDPVAVLSTDRGYRRLSPGTLTRVRDGEHSEEPVDPDEWHDVLSREFGVEYP